MDKKALAIAKAFLFCIYKIERKISGYKYFHLRIEILKEL